MSRPIENSALLDGLSFSLDDYLQKRAQDPSFIMVEIGHDSLPVAYQQPVEFRDQRAYIGIEAWLRDPVGVKHNRLAELRKTKEHGQNVFYITQDPGGEVQRDSDTDKSWYVGNYDPTTILPDKAADEVVVSNVFCDWHIVDDAARSATLLAETARLVTEAGKVILRETISPQAIRYMNNKLIAAAGLKIDLRVTPAEVQTWAMLESLFKAEPAEYPYPPESYYMFLSKERQT